MVGPLSTVSGTGTGAALFLGLRVSTGAAGPATAPVPPGARRAPPSRDRVPVLPVMNGFLLLSGGPAASADPGQLTALDVAVLDVLSQHGDDRAGDSAGSVRSAPRRPVSHTSPASSPTRIRPRSGRAGLATTI